MPRYRLWSAIGQEQTSRHVSQLGHGLALGRASVGLSLTKLSLILPNRAVQEAVRLLEDTDQPAHARLRQQLRHYDIRRHRICLQSGKENSPTTSASFPRTRHGTQGMTSQSKAAIIPGRNFA
jgi:hypothetical protein